MIKKFFFRKEERINERSLIQKLFTDGKTFVIPPFRVQLLIFDRENNPPVRLLITIPKKVIKKAVERNLLKRRIREAYRLNNIYLNDYLIANNKSLAIGLIYIDEQKADFHLIERKIIKILEEIIARIAKSVFGIL